MSPGGNKLDSWSRVFHIQSGRLQHRVGTEFCAQHRYKVKVYILGGLLKELIKPLKKAVGRAA